MERGPDYRPKKYYREEIEGSPESVSKSMRLFYISVRVVLVLLAVFVIIQTSIRGTSINLVAVFMPILFLAVPVVFIVYVIKKKNGQRIGKLFSLICFTVLLSMVTTYILFSIGMFVGDKEFEEFKKAFQVYEKPFLPCVKAYNSRTRFKEFDIDPFARTFKRKDNHGCLIVETNPKGEVNVAWQNYKLILQGKKLIAKKPEDIKYLIVVEYERNELYGQYTDGANAYWRAVPITVYRIEEDANIKLDSTTINGPPPDKHKSYNKRPETGGIVQDTWVDSQVVDYLKTLK
jgi:hypothetical protein